MHNTYTTNANVFDKLPEVLVHSILECCSPIDRFRAAAACQAFWKVYDEFQKQLTSHSIMFKGSTAGNMPLCPWNAQKLLVTFLDSSNSQGANTYNEVLSFIEQTRRDEGMHLSNVQELGIYVHKLSISNKYTLLCLEQLLQLLPSLVTLWFGTNAGLELLTHAVSGSVPMPNEPLQNLRRLSVATPSYTEQLVRLSTLLPSLNTLCLTINNPLDPTLLQPLSTIRQLRSLSLNLRRGQHSFPHCVTQITSLRHLKLATLESNGSNNSGIDMKLESGICGFQQLDTLILSDVVVSHPEALAQLRVTSLTLQSVGAAQPLSSSSYQHHHRPQQQLALLAAPFWPQLTRVQLAGNVSEQLLQAMLLPHPVAWYINVTASFETFDNFDSEYHRIKKRWRISSSGEVGIRYKADVTPTLGPAYLAAACPRLVELEGDFAMEAVRQLLLHDSSVRPKHKFLLRNRLLTHGLFRLWEVKPKCITATHTDGTTNRMYYFVPDHSTVKRIACSSEAVIPLCIRDLLLKLAVVVVGLTLLYWMKRVVR